jgi:periplasmic glucans biosynthesis protein
MVERRAFLQAALGALASSFASPGAAQDPAGKDAASKDAAAKAGAQFSRESVLELARSLAKKPFAPPANDLREPFASMTYEQYVGIRLKPGAAVWANDHKGFSLEPLHRSPVFSTRVELYIVENDALKQIVYDQTQFDYGGLKVIDKLPDMGFSGFRVLRAQGEGESTELALFQGASFFRASAPDQPFGVSARGLSIRTADARGEEFPIFRSFVIERPALGDNALIIHAVLDSPSVVGAYRFTVRPSEATIIDTELTLIPRADLDHIGVASLAGASLFTPLDRRRADDIRPAVGDMGGLQILTGKDEWLWRPLSNRADLQLSSFIDNNPKGFGFLQRQRDIGAFEDDVQHYERRPSLWIEPLGEWGEGSVQLVEIPSESEINQNIVAYWRPKQPLASGKETTYAYRQFWCWEPPARPPLAYVSEARGGRGGAPKSRRFLVVFTGDMLADPVRAETVRPVLSAGPGAVSKLHIYTSPRNRTCRVLFDLDPAGEAYCELRLVLQAGEETISETWLYRWTS